MKLNTQWVKLSFIAGIMGLYIGCAPLFNDSKYGTRTNGDHKGPIDALQFTPVLTDTDSLFNKKQDQLFAALEASLTKAGFELTSDTLAPKLSSKMIRITRSPEPVFTTPTTMYFGDGRMDLQLTITDPIMDKVRWRAEISLRNGSGYDESFMKDQTQDLIEALIKDLKPK
jgi:hypothetical protein